MQHGHAPMTSLLAKPVCHISLLGSRPQRRHPMKALVKAPSKMTIQKATASYEKWLSEQIPLLPEDLGRKHEAMRSSPFLFLRATYYRWTQLWPLVKKSLRNAKVVLAVGDLHVENFGTWRDAEGRLVWGVNDFDECCCLPYTNDLVRLATSARFAIEEQAIMKLANSDLGEQKDKLQKEDKEDAKKQIKELQKKLSDLRDDPNVKD